VTAAELSPEMLAQAADLLGVTPEELLLEEPECTPREGALTEAEIYELADIFIEKHGLTNVRWDGEYLRAGHEYRDEAFREVVANIILDTELTLDGTFPLERWREG